MSFSITTDIFCDECGDWVHGDVGTTILKIAAWERAKSIGWKKVKGKHLCPLCNGLAAHKQGGQYYDKNWNKISSE